MFGCGLGGIEQAFVDYTKALLVYGHKVTVLYHPDAQVSPQLQHMPIDHIAVRNRGLWDFFAVRRLRRMLEEAKPDVIIAHGNRAVSLLRKASKRTVPVIGVCHNYRYKRLIGCEALFTITEDLRHHVAASGQPEQSIYLVPNMIMLPAGLEDTPKPWRPVPVIGAMGRFVHKKGFHIFLEALYKLKQQGVPFTAVLGGEGEEKQHLQALVEKYGLADMVIMPGWVEDKDKFFESIDIFCLPSLHEAFGIVLLEAFLHRVPIVSTATEGPREIIIPGETGILAPSDDALALANALREMVQQKWKADSMVTKAMVRLQETYSLHVVAEKIHRALEVVGKKQ